MTKTIKTGIKVRLVTKSTFLKRAKLHQKEKPAKTNDKKFIESLYVTIPNDRVIMVEDKAHNGVEFEYQPGGSTGAPKFTLQEWMIDKKYNNFKYYSKSIQVEHEAKANTAKLNATVPVTSLKLLPRDEMIENISRLGLNVKNLTEMYIDVLFKFLPEDRIIKVIPAGLPDSYIWNGADMSFFIEAWAFRMIDKPRQKRVIRVFCKESIMFLVAHDPIKFGCDNHFIDQLEKHLPPNRIVEALVNADGSFDYCPNSTLTLRINDWMVESSYNPSAIPAKPVTKPIPEAMQFQIKILTLSEILKLSKTQFDLISGVDAITKFGEAISFYQSVDERLPHDRLITVKKSSACYEWNTGDGIWAIPFWVADKIYGERSISIPSAKPVPPARKCLMVKVLPEKTLRNLCRSIEHERPSIRVNGKCEPISETCFIIDLFEVITGNRIINVLVDPTRPYEYLFTIGPKEYWIPQFMIDMTYGNMAEYCASGLGDALKEPKVYPKATHTILLNYEADAIAGNMQMAIPNDRIVPVRLESDTFIWKPYNQLEIEVKFPWTVASPMYGVQPISSEKMKNDVRQEKEVPLFTAHQMRERRSGTQRIQSREEVEGLPTMRKLIRRQAGNLYKLHILAHNIKLLPEARRGNLMSRKSKLYADLTSHMVVLMHIVEIHSNLPLDSYRSIVKDSERIFQEIHSLVILVASSITLGKLHKG